MAILYDFEARCLFGIIFLHNAKQGRLLCAVSTHKSLPPQLTAHLFAMITQNPSMPGIAMCFFLGKLFEAIWRELRNLDDYALRGEREHGLPVINIVWPWIFLTSDSKLIARER